MICTIFLSNRSQQAMHPRALGILRAVPAFRGDMTISRLKIIIADTLWDVGDPISDLLQSRHEGDYLMTEELRSRFYPDT
jgi:hypothetical protein